MRAISKLIILFVFILNVVGSVYAIKASPYPVVIDQPDGSQITIRLNGDEYFKYHTTLDGYLVVKNKSGLFTYAEVDNLGELKSTNIIAKDIDKRSTNDRLLLSELNKNVDLQKINSLRRTMWKSKSIGSSEPQKSYPLTGTPKSIVILVNFTDVKFTIPNPQMAFTNLLNEKGYSANSGTGSARDYFRDNSSGVFDPEFDVVGPYDLPQSMSYYGENVASDNDNDANPRQMVIDACSKASAAGVDFAQYDTDKDGIVDNVFIYYAGYNEAENGAESSVWPHRWTLASLNTKFNGVSIFDYACTSELRSKSGGNMCGIGTFCHEFGHVLGLVDYYATNGATHHTLDDWNIMDGGAYLNSGRTPPAYSAYDRFFLGWLVPVELKRSGLYSLDNLSTSNTAYLISQNGNHNLNGANPSPVEFFTLENRQKTGWDTYLPGHGMLITHIYYNLGTWNDNGPNNEPLAMGVDIVEADGSASKYTLAGDPFPGTSNISAYDPILRNGTDIVKPLKNISETDGQITFSFGSDLIVKGDVSLFKTVQGTPSEIQTVSLTATNLTADVSLTLKSDTLFQIKKETDDASAWGSAITLIQVDGSVAETSIQIRYNPSVPSYTDIHTEKIVFQSGDNYFELPINGVSTREVLVVTPIAEDANNITFSSFQANWKKAVDATGYYLSIFSVNNEISTLNEGFDNGLIPSVGWTMNVSSTVGSSAYSGLSTPSLQFANTGEFVETEKYLLPAVGLSFYIKSLAESKGGFIVEALNDQNDWEKIDSIAITTSLNEKNKTYSFPGTKQYHKFRFRYFKGTGSITFDDVSVNFASTIEYIEKDRWITDLADIVYDLQPNTEYMYLVKASDKNIVYQYENITGASNVITVKTLAYPLSAGLLAVAETNGNIKVFLPTKENTLYVYDYLGKCIKVINPLSTVFEITDLPRGQVYILKADNRLIKIIN